MQTSSAFQQARELRPWHLGVVCLAAYGFPLGKFFTEFSSPVDVFAVLVLFAGIVVSVRRGCRVAEQPPESGGVFVALVAFAFSLFFLVFASLGSEPKFAYDSLLCCGFAFVWWLGGWHLFIQLSPAFLLGLTLVSPVRAAIGDFSARVMEIAAPLCGLVLDLCLVPNESQKIPVEIPDGFFAGSGTLDYALLVVAISLSICVVRNMRLAAMTLVIAPSLLFLPLLVPALVVLQAVSAFHFRIPVSDECEFLIVFVFTLGSVLLLSGRAARVAEFFLPERKVLEPQKGSIFEGVLIDWGFVFCSVLLVATGFFCSYLLATYGNQIS